MTAVSGIRYAVFIQNWSSTRSSTVMSLSILTQYVEYQPATTKRAGKAEPQRRTDRCGIIFICF